MAKLRVYTVAVGNQTTHVKTGGGYPEAYGIVCDRWANCGEVVITEKTYKLVHTTSKVVNTDYNKQ